MKNLNLIAWNFETDDFSTREVTLETRVQFEKEGRAESLASVMERNNFETLAELQSYYDNNPIAWEA